MEILYYDVDQEIRIWEAYYEIFKVFYDFKLNFFVSWCYELKPELLND